MLLATQTLLTTGPQEELGSSSAKTATPHSAVCTEALCEAVPSLPHTLFRKSWWKDLTSDHKSGSLPSGIRVCGATLSEGSRRNIQTREEGGSSPTHWSPQTEAAQKAKGSSVSAGQSP